MATPQVLMVLRSGGDFRPYHVDRLAGQVREYLPGVHIRCISDISKPGPVERIPMKRNWRGWWAKMEMFAPEIDGDFLFMDLDTAIVSDLSDIASIGKLAIMRDVYRPAGLQSSLMYVPQAVREEIWDRWIRHPQRWMDENRGDQDFLEKFWKGRAAFWQDELPGQVVSYKVHVRAAQRVGREYGDGAVPPNARVVAFHGKPRPWDIGW